MKSALAGYGQPAPDGKRDAGPLPDGASTGAVGDGATTSVDGSKPNADGGGDASAGG